MTPAEAFMEELATRVAAKVVEELRANPVLQPRVVTVEHAAILLDRTPEAVRKMLVAGKLRVTKIDGRVQIAVRDIDVLIANGK